MKLALIAGLIVVSASAFAASPRTHRAAAHLFHLEALTVTVLPAP
jgi:hypothetical protein